MIIERRDCSRQRIAPEQLVRGSPTVRLTRATGHDLNVLFLTVPAHGRPATAAPGHERKVLFLPVPPHACPVTASPVRRYGVPAAVNVDDVMVAKTHKMINHKPQSLVVSGTHNIDAVGYHPTPDENDRHTRCKIIEHPLPHL